MPKRRGADANKKRSAAMKGNSNARKLPRLDEPSTTARPRVRPVPGQERGHPPSSACSAEELQRRKEAREQKGRREEEEQERYDEERRAAEEAAGALARLRGFADTVAYRRALHWARLPCGHSRPGGDAMQGRCWCGETYNIGEFRAA